MFHGLKMRPHRRVIHLNPVCVRRTDPILRHPELTILIAAIGHASGAPGKAVNFNAHAKAPAVAVGAAVGNNWVINHLLDSRQGA